MSVLDHVAAKLRGIEYWVDEDCGCLVLFGAHLETVTADLRDLLDRETFGQVTIHYEVIHFSEHDPDRVDTAVVIEPNPPVSLDEIYQGNFEVALEDAAMAMERLSLYARRAHRWIDRNEVYRAKYEIIAALSSLPVFRGWWVQEQEYEPGYVYLDPEFDEQDLPLKKEQADPSGIPEVETLRFIAFRFAVGRRRFRWRLLERQVRFALDPARRLPDERVPFSWNRIHSCRHFDLSQAFDMVRYVTRAARSFS